MKSAAVFLSRKSHFHENKLHFFLSLVTKFLFTSANTSVLSVNTEFQFYVKIIWESEVFYVSCVCVCVESSLQLGNIWLDIRLTSSLLTMSMYKLDFLTPTYCFQAFSSFYVYLKGPMFWKIYSTNVN